MKHEISFRFAEKTDVPLIFEFIKKLAVYEKASQAVLATEALLEEWMFEKKKAEVVFLQIEEAGETREIGFCFFYETFPAYVGKGGLYIDDLYIDEEYRGRGYGKELLSFMAGIALERGFGRMEWCCINWNTSSLAFYRSMGATVLEECSILRVPEDIIRKIADQKSITESFQKSDCLNQ